MPPLGGISARIYNSSRTVQVGAQYQPCLPVIQQQRQLRLLSYANLLTNGDGSTVTGWNDYYGSSGAISLSEGRIRIAGTGGPSGYYTNISTIPGLEYRVRGTLYPHEGSRARMGIDGGTFKYADVDGTDVDFSFFATLTTHAVVIAAGGNAAWVSGGEYAEFDDLVVEMVSVVGVLTGTSDLIFSPSSTLTGKGALSGTSPLTFTPTSTLTGKGALSGTSALVFSPSSTLTGKGALSGSSTLTFSPTGTATGKGALTGTTSLVFSPAGTLSGKGALTGTSSLVFAPAGVLAGLAPISGTSSLTFSPTSTLTGKGALTGSSSLLFTASGTLSLPAAPGDLVGSSSLTFSPAGNITALAALAGNSDFAFTVSGSLTAFVVVPPRRFVIRTGDQSQSGGSGRAYGSESSRGYASRTPRGSRNSGGRSYSRGGR